MDGCLFVIPSHSHMIIFLRFICLCPKNAVKRKRRWTRKQQKFSWINRKSEFLLKTLKNFFLLNYSYWNQVTRKRVIKLESETAQHNSLWMRTIIRTDTFLELFLRCKYFAWTKMLQKTKKIKIENTAIRGNCCKRMGCFRRKSRYEKFRRLNILKPDYFVSFINSRKLLIGKKFSR